MSPQEMVISIGAERAVANGRARVRLSVADPVMTKMEVLCKGETRSLVMSENKISRGICGIQIKVLEVYKGTFPSTARARLEITWE